MSLNEFEIISRYFASQKIRRDDVAEGIGDDCALLQPRRNELLAVSMDTLVNGVHFPVNTQAFDIGYKALAVNLSDLAAMGAEPQWATLALTMPEQNNEWLAGFCEGLFHLAGLYQVQLVGGDLTRGPLSITIQIHGSVPENQVHRRSGASAGDGIYVTGYPGDAALGLMLAQSDVDNTDLDTTQQQYLLDRLNRPTPRVETGMAIRGIASSAIDISDGLNADLAHMLDAGNCGARIDIDSLPLSEAAKSFGHSDDVVISVLTGGDDYELCFTASDKHHTRLEEISQLNRHPITRIGMINPEPGLRCFARGEQVTIDETGFQHF